MAISLIKKGKKAGHYRVRIQPIDKLTGKAISWPSQVTSQKSLAEAKQIEQFMWVSFHDQQDRDWRDVNRPLADTLDEYVEEQQKLGRWSNSTAYDWSYTVRLVKDFFGRQKIKDIREEDIRRFARNYVKRHKAKASYHSTVDRQLQNLRAFFLTLMDSGLSRNPVPMRPLSKFFRRSEMDVPQEHYVFSDKEISSIRDEVYQELDNCSFTFWNSRLAILLALSTGMRPQEVQAIHWSDFVKDGQYIVLKIHDAWSEKDKCFTGSLKDRRRGEYRSTLPVDNRLVETLRSYHKKQQMLLKRHEIINKNDLVLLNLTDYDRCQKGLPVSQRAMNEMIKRVAKKVNVQNGSLSVTMYTCRHTVATKLGNTPGMSYPWAASRLGHSLKMFMRTYVHVDRDRSEQMLNLVTGMANTKANTKNLI